MIEHSRLIWKDGHQRQAIHHLEAVIAQHTLQHDHQADGATSLDESMAVRQDEQNLLLAQVRHFRA